MSTRVLVVEDEFMIGLDIGQQLADAGYEVVGPATSVEKALRFIAEPGCDVAILDVNLGDETSEPVARKLRGSGKPFVCFLDIQRTMCCRGSRVRPCYRSLFVWPTS
jgi:DNA-binding response OmpR family regulator